MPEKHKEIYQPIESKFEPDKQKKSAINLEEFIKLLDNEEEYYKNQKHETKLLITRLRKIFYDEYGWNKELIRGAAKIKCRYQVKIVPDKEAAYPKSSSGGVKREKKSSEPVHKHREVTVREGDWLNHNVGSIPLIYANDNQEVTLPNGLYCDMGHVLAGMDAANYPEPVAPLPNWLMWMRFIFPHVNKNTDAATWLGDISSSAGEFLFETFRYKSQLTVEEKQKIINAFAPGSDMLGNIDSYIIPAVYNTSTEAGYLVTEMFRDYYYENGYGYYYMKRRCAYFCYCVGLKGWDGEKFENEKKWLRYNLRQLRNTTAFYVFTRFSKPAAYWLALMVWVRRYDRTLELKRLLHVLLNSLKAEILQEPSFNLNETQHGKS